MWAHIFIYDYICIPSCFQGLTGGYKDRPFQNLESDEDDTNEDGLIGYIFVKAGTAQQDGPLRAGNENMFP